MRYPSIFLSRRFRPLLALLPCLLFACGPGGNQPPGGAAPPPSAGEPVTAFVAVNVIPMHAPLLMADQTVLVRGGRIVAVGPAKSTPIPPGAHRIDGRNKYLMPGLADCHVHFPPDTADHPATLRLFLANGITTVVNMEGNPALLRLRERIARGRVRGPALFTTGPFLHRPLVTTPREVEGAVVAQKRAGYDFIKLHGQLSREAYACLMETARREGIRVVGHVPANLGIEAALAARQPLIVHAEEYLYAYFSAGRDLPTAAGEIDSMARCVAAATARAGTWVSPTLTVFNGIITQVNDIGAVLDRPEMRFLPPSVVRQWTPPANPYVKRWKKDDVLRFSAQYRVMEYLVRALHAAGVPLLVGSDCLVPAVVPGFSIHDEMHLLVLAGLPPYEVLKAATVNAARFLGKEQQTGTVEPGKQADLLLLDANPLRDIGNAKRRAGVMLGGQWMPEAELQAGLSGQ